MSEVVFELAKWLLWIELFGEDDRVDRTVELLQRYVLEKHNGLVTRLNDGKEERCSPHVERIVEGAGSMSAESKESFPGAAETSAAELQAIDRDRADPGGKSEGDDRPRRVGPSRREKEIQLYYL